jgi:hypothetical protein
VDGTAHPLEQSSDGSTPSPLTQPTPRRPQPLSATLRDRPLPPLPPDAEMSHIPPNPMPDPHPPQAQRPSVVSFAAQNHIRYHRNQAFRGTWRTRMKRTKCWRCELEAKRKTSMETLHQLKRKLLCDGDAWAESWERTKDKLQWTCFCRYAGYQDNDEESEGTRRITRERVRLGRFGGVLFGR